MVIGFWAGWFLAASPAGGRYLPSADGAVGLVLIIAIALAHVLAGALIGRWWLVPLMAIAPVVASIPFTDEWPLTVVWIAPVGLLLVIGLGIRWYVEDVRST